MIQQVTSQENFDEIISENPKVLMEFYASWCPHCKAFYPVLEKASETLNAQGVAVAQTEIDSFEAIADRYGIQSIPTLTVFESGALTALSAGQRDESAVLDFVAQSLSEKN